MNKKGQTAVFGYIIMFIGIIVALTLLVASAQSKGQITDLVTVANESLGTMTNGTTLYITNYRSCSGLTIFNATGDVEIPSTNYTATNNVVYNGALSVSVAPSVSITAGQAYNKGTATFDGTCEPLTYDENSASRTIIDLVIVLAGIALALWVLDKAGVIDLFGR